MRIIIAGDGKVGLALTRLLSQEGHDLVTIDSNRAVLERDMQQFDVMTVVGNCATMATLNERRYSRQKCSSPPQAPMKSTCCAALQQEK